MWFTRVKSVKYKVELIEPKIIANLEKANKGKEGSRERVSGKKGEILIKSDQSKFKSKKHIVQLPENFSGKVFLSERKI